MARGAPQEDSRAGPAHGVRQSLIIMGTDGAGKTTLAKALAEDLRRNGFSAQFAANVSGRRWLTQRARSWGISFPTFTQDFIELAIRTVNVALNTRRANTLDGLTVMDRHLYCQLVLRSVRGQPLGLLLPWLAHRAIGSSLVVVLDVDPQTAFDRISSREDDFETLEYLQASRKEYLRLAAANGWVVLDGSRPPHQLLADLRSLTGYPVSRPILTAREAAGTNRR